MSATRCFHDLRDTYHYYRNPSRAPLICLCKVETAEHTTGYGWTLCSPRDQPRYEIGRLYAYNRAVAALRRGTLLETGLAEAWVLLYARPLRRQEARATMALCQATSLRALVDHGDWRELPWAMQPERIRGAR